MCNCNSTGTDTLDFNPEPILFIKNSQLWSASEDASQVIQLTNDPNFPIYDAIWSPNKEYIAIVGPANSQQPGEFGTAIYVIDSDGLNKRKISNPPDGGIRYQGDIPRRLSWSPDNKKIAFTRMKVPEALGNFDLFTVDIGNNSESPLFVSDTIMFVNDWHPNSEQILITYIEPYKQDSSEEIIGGNSKLGFVNANREIIHFTNSSSTSNTGNAKISPDSKMIAYSEENALYLLDLETLKKKALTVEEGYFEIISWGGRESFILINESIPGECNKVFKYSIEEGSMHEFLTNQLPGECISVTSWY